SCAPAGSGMLCTCVLPRCCCKRCGGRRVSILVWASVFDGLASDKMARYERIDMGATGMTKADIIIENARVLTLDPQNPRAEAIAIASGSILALGDRDAIAGLAGQATRRIDAGGASVLPGFIDSHIHLFAGGAQLQSLSLA